MISNGFSRLKAIQIKFDGAPGVRSNQLAEVVGQLGARQRIDLVVKVLAHAPNGTGVSVNGFGLQAFELEVLQVGTVPAGKGLRIRTRVEPAGIGEHGQTPYKLRINMRHNGGMCLQLTNSPTSNSLRVAASSNMAFESEEPKAVRPSTSR